MNSQATNLPLQPIIITVHGTGSGGRTEKAAKWWENGSVFCGKMTELLRHAFAFDEPFQWSGLNWESARQAAGDELWKRLQQNEQQKRPYHLVSHSHGGSVVWAALIRSVQEKTKLDYLASWTTIGTPFLTFVPTPTNWPLVLASLAVGTGIAATGLSIAPPLDEIGYVYANATASELVTTLAPLLISTAIFISATALLVSNFLSQLRYRHRRILRQSAARWYGPTWLGIWHPQDEPIAGLAATLDKAISITSRRADSFPTPIRWLGRVLDKLLADVPDELAWRQFVRKLQGNDLRARALASVDRCPPELRPGWPAIPGAISQAMLLTANSRAATTLEGMRALLGSAYETRTAKGMVLGAGKLVNWGELIHTSYFESDDLCALIATHVLAAEGSGISTAAPNPGRFARLPDSELTYAIPILQRPWSPKRLRELAAALVLLISAIFLSLSTAASKTSLFPYTTNFQIQKIASAVFDQGVINVGANPYVGSIILKLMALGYLANPLTVLKKLAADDGRFEAAQPVALVYGYNGEFGKLDEIVGAVTNDLDSFRATTLRVTAIDGASRANRDVPEDLIKATAVAVNEIKSDSGRDVDVIVKFANALYRLKRIETANSILAHLWKIAPDQYSCDGNIGAVDGAELQDAASFVLDQCGQSAKWTSRPWDRIRLMQLAGRNEDAKKAAALVPASTTLKQLAEQIKVELFRNEAWYLNEQISKYLATSSIARADMLYKRCGLESAPMSQLASPVIVPIGYDDFFSLGDIVQAYERSPKAPNTSLLIETRERFLKLCLSNVALGANDLDWAENLLKASLSDTEARIIYEPTLKLGRKFEDTGQYDLAVQAYSAVIESGAMDLAVRRETMLRLESLALSQSPPDLNSLQNLARHAQIYDKELTVRFQKSVVSTLSTTTDVAVRSDARANLAIYMSQFGLARDARLVAEGATVPKDLLRGYLGVLRAATTLLGRENETFSVIEDEGQIICEADCTG
jgi:hypothetical protein